MVQDGPLGLWQALRSPFCTFACVVARSVCMTDKPAAERPYNLFCGACSDLQGNNLTGALPDAWAAAAVLPFLTVLSLAGNQLSGGLPASWGDASALSHLVTLCVSSLQSQMALTCYFGSLLCCGVASVCTLLCALHPVAQAGGWPDTLYWEIAGAGCPVA